MEKELRCITKNGIEKFIPEGLTKRPAYLQKHGLTIQDLDQKEEEVKSLFVSNEIQIQEEYQDLDQKEEEEREDTTLTANRRGRPSKK